uniref:Uncharacterized protein n=1 Tax=Arundo donax TaxID=35708 RepID=A0A0A9FW09_ARUDO
MLLITFFLIIITIVRKYIRWFCVVFPKTSFKKAPIEVRFGTKHRSCADIFPVIYYFL